MTHAPVYKTMHGIRYYSVRTDEDGYRLWESKTHPSYKHWQKIKKPKNQQNNHTTHDDNKMDNRSSTPMKNLSFITL